MVPSIYRAIARTEGPTPSIDRLRFNCTLRWSRMLYDWLIDQGIDAVIVDAKESMDVQTVKPFLARLCQATGLDVDAVVYQWPKVDQQRTGEATKCSGGITRDILESGGLRTDKGVGEIVAEQEEKKWREEFGEEIAGLLGDLVERTVEDYSYMRQKAIKLDE